MKSTSPTEFRRRLLEQLGSATGDHTNLWPHLASLVEEGWTPGLNVAFDVLERQGRVELSKTHDPSTWRAKLTALGRESLEVSEGEWNISHKPVVNSNTMNITGSTVGNVAQVSGSEGATVTQTFTSNDLRSVHEAIDRLVAALKASPTLDANTKKDAQIDAEQFKGEVTKTKPNPSRIREYLETFTKLATAAAAVPHLVELVEKLKVFLPGGF